MIGIMAARLQTACTRDGICAIMVNDRSFKEEKLDLTASAGVI
jgi:hypothetical protein